jgi:hypothetical protein
MTLFADPFAHMSLYLHVPLLDYCGQPPFFVISIIYLFIYFNSDLPVITRFPWLISAGGETINTVDTVVCIQSEI